VNEVRWKSCRVFAFIHRLIVKIVSDVKLLQNSRNNARGRDIFVRLYTW